MARAIKAEAQRIRFPGTHSNYSVRQRVRRESAEEGIHCHRAVSQNSNCALRRRCEAVVQEDFEVAPVLLLIDGSGHVVEGYFEDVRLWERRVDVVRRREQDLLLHCAVGDPAVGTFDVQVHCVRFQHRDMPVDLSPDQGNRRVRDVAHQQSSDGSIAPPEFASFKDSSDEGAPELECEIYFCTAEIQYCITHYIILCINSDQILKKYELRHRFCIIQCPKRPKLRCIIWPKIGQNRVSPIIEFSGGLCERQMLDCIPFETCRISGPSPKE